MYPGRSKYHMLTPFSHVTLQWHHNEHDGVSIHLSRDCLLHHLYRRRLNKTSKVRVTGLCAGNSLVTGELPAQRASNVENASIWWRHHDGTIWSLSQMLHTIFSPKCHFTVPLLCSENLYVILGVGWELCHVCNNFVADVNPTSISK